MTAPVGALARMEAHHQIEALAAIRHAHVRYRGAAGDVLGEALQAYKDLGYLAPASAPIARLIRELMTPCP